MGPGWHLRSRACAPQARIMATGVREDVGHEYTCFMRGGEDARLHGRFSGGTCHCSSKASRGKDLEVEEPVARGDCASFHFHATLAGLQGATLIRDEVEGGTVPTRDWLLNLQILTSGG